MRTVDRTTMTPGARHLAKPIVVIWVTGVALGLVYNWFGLSGARPWGLPWIAEDRVAQLASLVVVGSGSADAATDPYVTDISDPLAVPGTTPAARDLPEIPAVGRPVQIELRAVKQLVDAGAALVVDAREPAEYAAGHIPGSINLPYDEVATDPVRLESVDAGGRPIITYCGGGECEQSLSLAYDLYGVGHERVAVYLGGFPQWVEAGYPVARAPVDAAEGQR